MRTFEKREASKNPAWLERGVGYDITVMRNRDTGELLISPYAYATRVRNSSIPVYLLDGCHLFETDLPRRSFSASANSTAEKTWELVGSQLVLASVWATFVGCLTGRFSCVDPLGRHHSEVQDFLNFCEGCAYADKTGINERTLCHGVAECPDHVRIVCLTLWAARRARGEDTASIDSFILGKA